MDTPTYFLVAFHLYFKLSLNDMFIYQQKLVSSHRKALYLGHILDIFFQFLSDVEIMFVRYIGL